MQTLALAIQSRHQRQSILFGPMTNPAQSARHPAGLVVEPTGFAPVSCPSVSFSLLRTEVLSATKCLYTESVKECQALRQRFLEGRVRIELTLGFRQEDLQSPALPLSPPSPGVVLERGARPYPPQVPWSVPAASGFHGPRSTRSRDRGRYAADGLASPDEKDRPVALPGGFVWRPVTLAL